MTHLLHYWPMLQGRGEFVRLALEDAAIPYTDVARDEAHGGMEGMLDLMGEGSVARPPFAPPFLQVGEVLVAQTANILLYLGEKHGLVPGGEAERYFANQLQLTIMDFVAEVHDTHHPVGSGLYYEEQKPEARRRSKDFLAIRAPKFLGYFTAVLNRSGGDWLLGGSCGYPDLSLFQVMAGLSYAFPKAMKRLDPDYPELVALHDRVAARPAIKAYLASPRRIAFNEEGIFRRYPELDDA